MRILVTGGTGFLGRHVTRLLENSPTPHNVISVGSKEANLCDQDQTFDLFNETRPEMVFHLAAQVGGIQANKNSPADYWYENLMMGMNVLDQCSLKDIKKLIIVGTVCSYPQNTALPFHEDHLWLGYPEETNAPYGIAKKSLLVGALAYREQYGLNTIFLLPANLYGPGDHFFKAREGHVIADMIRKFCSLDPTIQLWGNGSATRDFLYVEDAAEGIVKAAELYNGSYPVNLGTGVEINIRNLADLIKAETKYGGRVVWDQDKPNGQARRVLDTSRAKALFAWEANTPLKMGLRKTIDWYLASSEIPDKLEVGESSGRLL
jgi:GDP-L-fucose synthase